MEKSIDLWRYWGFDYWESNGVVGVKRRVAFVKPAMIGEVARYYAEDTIVWSPVCSADLETLWRSIKPIEDVMTQRFLFLTDTTPPICRIKSFLFGIRGYLEFHSYWFGQGHDARLKDLVPLVEKAANIWENAAQREVSDLSYCRK